MQHFPVCFLSTSLSLPFLPQLSTALRIRTSTPATYHDSKQAASEYQAAKQALTKAFHKAGLGAWVKKPTEQDQFTLAT